MSEVWNKVVDEIIATMESEERTAFWQAFDDNCLIEHIQSRLASVKNKLDYIPDKYLDDAVNRLAG